jgi:UDP-glucose:(heptosyl)LPS alpha-1,3-glucosyltransferase
MKWLKSLKAYGRSLGWATLAWKWIVAPLEKLSLGDYFCRRIIAISDRIRKDLASEYGRTAGVDLVYHGVDLEKFHPDNALVHRAPIRNSLGIRDEEFVALFVGNLQKGAVPAIEAVSSIPEIRLVLVSGSSNGKERELVSRLRMDSRVTWVPLSREVEKYFSCADCFVFPTLYEPFGMVISEAMASGIPVITNKSAGASELIDNGVSGLLTDDPWGVGEIASCLKKLVEEPGTRRRMGLAARKAVEPYTWDRCAKETMDVYQKVLETKMKTKRG